MSLPQQGWHRWFRGRAPPATSTSTREYTIYLTADGYVIGVEGAAGADLSDVYYVAGVYGEESRYNNEQMTWYAQAVSLADGSVSDIELDKTNAGALENFKDKPNGGI